MGLLLKDQVEGPFTEFFESAASQFVKIFVGTYLSLKYSQVFALSPIIRIDLTYSPLSFDVIPFLRFPV